MDPVHVGAWLSLLLMVAGVLWKAIKIRDEARDDRANARRRLNAVERRVQIIWRAWNSRARLALQDESGSMSPYHYHEQDTVLSDKVREAFSELAPLLQRRYRETWFISDEDELAFHIEEEFGPRIIDEVCRKLGWHDGRCLAAAAIIAKE